MRVASHKDLVKGRHYMRLHDEKSHHIFERKYNNTLTFRGMYNGRTYEYSIEKFDNTVKEVTILECPIDRFKRELKEILK
jgi:hypothetical protein